MLAMACRIVGLLWQPRVTSYTVQRRSLLGGKRTSRTTVRGARIVVRR